MGFFSMVTRAGNAFARAHLNAYRYLAAFERDGAKGLLAILENELATLDKGDQALRFTGLAHELYGSFDAQLNAINGNRLPGNSVGVTPGHFRNNLAAYLGSGSRDVLWYGTRLEGSNPEILGDVLRRAAYFQDVYDHLWYLRGDQVPDVHVRQDVTAVYVETGDLPPNWMVGAYDEAAGKIVPYAPRAVAVGDGVNQSSSAPSGVAETSAAPKSAVSLGSIPKTVGTIAVAGVVVLLAVVLIFTFRRKPT